MSEKFLIHLLIGLVSIRKKHAQTTGQVSEIFSLSCHKQEEVVLSTPVIQTCFERRSSIQQGKTEKMFLHKFHTRYSWNLDNLIDT